MHDIDIREMREIWNNRYSFQTLGTMTFDVLHNEEYNCLIDSNTEMSQNPDKDIEAQQTIYTDRV